MEKKAIIIDCDPGYDDTLAILWALASPEIEIKAITTVAGNQTIENVTNNAMKVLEKVSRKDIPIAMGATKPLTRNLIVNDEALSESVGLEGSRLSKCSFEKSKMAAIELMITMIEEAKESITLVALGPLTNVATLMIVRPDLMNKIEQISLMGGGVHGGNRTPVAEYNMWVDPEAAKVVFDSGMSITMAGLDVTHKAYITREENEILRIQGDEISAFAAELIDSISKFHHEAKGIPGAAMHDPTAIAALIHPQLFTSVSCNVDVDISEELTRGMTVVDMIGDTDKMLGEETKKNTKVLFEVDRESYVELFFAAIKTLGESLK